MRHLMRTHSRHALRKMRNLFVFFNKIGRGSGKFLKIRKLTFKLYAHLSLFLPPHFQLLGNASATKYQT